MSQLADIGLIGLGVMGRNLAMNMTDKGYRVAVYNLEPEVTTEVVTLAAQQGKELLACDSVTTLLDKLHPPRTVMLMITAGEPVDQQLEQLHPLLQAGDIVLDGGNSYYQDSQRRYRYLQKKHIEFLGVGVSGGELGARFGPSLMAGGSATGFAQLECLLNAIAAKVDDQPCCAYLGPDGAGHFVKMVHNGIEYADMQLIAEVYALMRAQGMSYAQMHDMFAQWNLGELQSYLIEITADILKATDPDTNKPLVEMILDRAGQKGTGRWTAVSSLDFGVAAPTIVAAVAARALSAIKDQRLAAAQYLAGKPLADKPLAAPETNVPALAGALLAAKVCAYAQGFALLHTASEHYDWRLKLADVASVWRGGCVIRAAFLTAIQNAFNTNPALKNLFLDDYFQDVMARCQQDLRRVVITGVSTGVALPALSSALAYFDSYRSAQLPANLLQAQRDYFGAHGYERIDKPGQFHTQWL